MIKNEIIKELSKLDEMGISREDYVVVYGAAMVMFGIKENTHDIDVNGYYNAFRILEQKFGMHKRDYPKRKGVKYVPVTECIDMFEPRSMSHPVEYELIDGYYVQGPLSILQEKRMRNRQKDQEDVKLITEWLMNQPSLHGPYVIE